MRSPWTWAVLFLCGIGLCGFDQPHRRAPEIRNAPILNAPAESKLSLKALRGRVVLIAFWNSDDPGFDDFMETLKDWYGRYRFRGLQIVAVHIPRWDVEKKDPDIAALARARAIEFPVIQDKDASVRAAYSELMSPAVFCVDRKGYIRGAWSAVFDMDSVRVMLETLLGEVP